MAIFYPIDCTYDIINWKKNLKVFTEISATKVKVKFHNRLFDGEIMCSREHASLNVSSNSLSHSWAGDSWGREGHSFGPKSGTKSTDLLTLFVILAQSYSPLGPGYKAAEEGVTSLDDTLDAICF